MDALSEPPARAPQRSLARKLIVDLSIMTVIGVVLALIGPFGSFGDPLAIRLMVWLGLAYAGYFIYSPVGWVVAKLSRSLDLPELWLWVAGTLIATVPMAVIVWWLNQLGRSEIYVLNAQEALLHYSYVLVIGAGITLLFHVIGRPVGPSKAAETGIEDRVETAVADQSAPAKTEQTPPEQATGNPLVDQLPAELGSDVIALEMEDHYVRVHTALGSELVLMRLRDAMVHIGHVEGRQVHRSWWVARGAVEDVTREGRNVRLMLARGIEAPVSRAQVSELKQAGWI